MATNNSIITPNSYSKAIKSPQANNWQLTLNKEYQAIIQNKTYVLCPLPKGHKAIKSKWCFKLKHHTNSSINHYKAHWVAKGFTQHHSINYNVIFMPILHFNNLHILLMWAVILNYNLHIIDIMGAFLQSDINHESYVEQPKGYVDLQHPDWVCRLQKCLYGLKQSPYKWNQTLNKHLHASGFTPSAVNPCLYYSNSMECHSFIGVYINNCTILTDAHEIDQIKHALTKAFPIKDLGLAK